jgi:Na+/melibiose symporter-like transporter
VADYSEWKNKRRATAIIFSAMILGLKAGLSIGGALVAGILGAYGYQEGLAVQSGEVIQGIKLLISVFPTITFLVGIGCLFFYAIDKKMEVRIETELNERRNN